MPSDEDILAEEILESWTLEQVRTYAQQAMAREYRENPSMMGRDWQHCYPSGAVLRNALTHTEERR